ncbi:MAG: hypothetical protein ACJAUP_001403 [Cellvibrionaceae bacterium]|jgi:hypothetical protein
MADNSTIKSAVEHWLQEVVIGLQLCPFAKAPMNKKKIRFIVSNANTEEQLNDDLIKECQHLDLEKNTETTLLICPYMLKDFFYFCQFLKWANTTLKKNQWQSIYQIAHFHPNYCFTGTEPEHSQNLTNRSPYPILHILREASVEQALNRFDEPESIPERNIRTMNTLSETEKQRYFYYLFK